MNSEKTSNNSYQRASAGVENQFKPRTGLSFREFSINATNPDKATGVVVQLMPVSGLIMLRAGRDLDSLESALERHCDLTLPAKLSCHSSDSLCISWLSPDAWLLCCSIDRTADLVLALREASSGHVAIVDVSGGYSQLRLRGGDARSVLMKSTAYDVHPDNFPPNKVVNTVFAKTQATVRCITSDDYELTIRRSFAVYVLQWLLRAGEEFSISVQS
ncbi:MAG: sarcosine oxidase subunit gamma family protein [Granulosicoccus sp.]|nr:sarcosine oxidase subunit gamma family protein [Granulosicoccus sp.]